MPETLHAFARRPCPLARRCAGVIARLGAIHSAIHNHPGTFAPLPRTAMGRRPVPPCLWPCLPSAASRPLARRSCPRTVSHRRLVPVPALPPVPAARTPALRARTAPSQPFPSPRGRPPAAGGLATRGWTTNPLTEARRPPLNPMLNPHADPTKSGLILPPMPSARRAQTRRTPGTTPPWSLP